MPFLLNKRSVFLSVIFFVFYMLCVVCLRTLTTEHLALSEDWGYIATIGVLFVTTANLWHFNKKILWLFLCYIALYTTAALTKRWGNMILSEREIAHTFCLASFLFSMILIIYRLGFCLNSKILKTTAFTLCLLSLLAPSVMIAYFALNKAVFSSDILLTLFQTNMAETMAYLRDQNLILWGLALLLILCFLGALIYFLSTFNIQQKCPMISLIFSLFLLFYIAFDTLPKVNVNFVSNISHNTYETLKNFTLYSQSRENRLQQIEALKNTVSSKFDKGIFALIIGESETRNHMSAYGYPKQTTPWLEEIKNNDNVILFDNAYSNHTHTVPTLTYALSSQNQYNNQDLNQALSVLEVAKAAGFEVYWISNQPKESVFLTPLSVISSTADHQVWLNSAIGNKLSTEYYDEKIIEVLEHIKLNPKSLIIIHLMGSHGAYRDRYPAQFQKFTDGTKLVNTYDNSILYTDFVLKGITQALMKNKNFQALVYFSDHGDDPDNKLGHESSRFTFEMSRIPLFLIASNDFASTSDFINLSNNKHAVFTNDLIYEMMLDLMQISFEKINPSYSILRENYILNRDNALTLHGQKRLKDE